MTKTKDHRRIAEELGALHAGQAMQYERTFVCFLYAEALRRHRPDVMMDHPTLGSVADQVHWIAQNNRETADALWDRIESCVKQENTDQAIEAIEKIELLELHFAYPDTRYLFGLAKANIDDGGRPWNVVGLEREIESARSYAQPEGYLFPEGVTVFLQWLDKAIVNKEIDLKALHPLPFAWAIKTLHLRRRDADLLRYRANSLLAGPVWPEEYPDE